MKKPRWQINISAPVMQRNRALGTLDPPIIVRDYQDGQPPYTMAEGVRILGPSTVVVSAGGSAWIETDGPIELTGARLGLDQ